MNFNHVHYVPCLRWKQGEYLAVSHLQRASKDNLTPLIEIPEIGYDFEKRSPAKSIDDHIKDVGKRVQAKWGNRCFIDMGLIPKAERMASGIHPMKYVFDDLRSRQCTAIPVMGLNQDQAYQQSVREIILQDQAGFCLRLSIEDARKPDIKTKIDALLSILTIKHENCDLVLDLSAPNFQPLEGFSRLLQAILQKLPYLNIWRTLTVLGTSFPKTMGGIKAGSEIIPRYEWQLYKQLITHLKQAKLRLPTFGDYVISHPDILDIDMRKVKPAASIRYTTDDSWYIIKGKNVRDNGFEQYREHCRVLVNSRYYAGAAFSKGDEYITLCAQGCAKTGSLTTWRWIGTNHHLEKVTRDIASFYAS